MKKYLILFALMFVVTGCSRTSSESLTIYTTRHYEVDRQIFANFEQETGIKLNVVEMREEELVSRLNSEGDTTPADIVMVVGAEHIYTLDSQMQMLQPLNIDEITNTLESDYYGDNWFGFAKRSRDVLVANDFDYDISSYFDLANPELQGEILVRSSSSLYNQALIAAMLQVYGNEATEAFLDGFVSNFAKRPDGGDRDQIRSVMANEASIAIANGYYLDGMLRSSDTNEVAAAQNVHFADLDYVFENISFAAKVSNNPLADQFLVYLNDQQEMIATQNGEIPTNKTVPFENSSSLRTPYRAMNVDFENLGSFLSQAYDLMLKSGWE